MQKGITQSSLYYSNAGRPHVNYLQTYLKDPSPSAAEVFTGVSFIFKIVNWQERNSFTSVGRTNSKLQKHPVISKNDTGGSDRAKTEPTYPGQNRPIHHENTHF